MSDVRDWLLAEGGPSIRVRTARELVTDFPPRALAKLERELLDSALVQRWLACVRPSHAFGDVHGSRDDCLENALGRLVQLGCRAGMRPLDEKTAPLRGWLRRPSTGDTLPLHYARTCAAKFLFLAGYRDAAVSRLVSERLDRVARFCRRRNYDIYVDPADHPGFPRGFRGRPLLDPRLSPDGETPMPSIRDVHAFASCRASADLRTRRGIDAVTAWFCHPDYAHLAPGYGVCRLGPKRFWAIGWDVRLPAAESGLVTHNLVLFAHLARARRRPDFASWLDRLEGHRNAAGRYVFPRALLPERPNQYWVAGAHLGLEASRRSTRALELESTFYREKIRRLCRS